MRRVLRVLMWCVIIFVALVGALFGIFVYTPDPEVPRLSGHLTEGAIESGGLRRTYATYVPQGLPKGAPLVVVMHGSGGNGARMRKATGYAFDRLADEHGFAVVYPNKGQSSRNSVQYFADLNGMTRPPDSSEVDVADGVRVERLSWRRDSPVEVELIAIHGGGHGIPQPYRRSPRLLGPTPKEPNGPALIWAFFERQRDTDPRSIGRRS
jgi:poly(3-hydroxybutyrate) depolymerase